MSDKKEYNLMSLSTAVFITFLVMKLAKIGEVANWSWWWVTCPLWIGLAIAIGFLIVVVLIAAAYATHETMKDKRIQKQPTNPKISRFQQRLDEMNKQRGSNKPRCAMCGNSDATWTSTRGNVCNTCHDNLLGLD